MILSFSRMRKIPHRMKNVSCLTKASFRSRRFPSLTHNQPVSTPATLMSIHKMSSQSLPYLTPLVTSANCSRSYFLRSWWVGMWPLKKRETLWFFRVGAELVVFVLFPANFSFWPAASSRAAGRWESSSCSSDWSDDSGGKSTTGSPPLQRPKQSSHHDHLL